MRTKRPISDAQRAALANARASRKPAARQPAPELTLPPTLAELGFAAAELGFDDLPVEDLLSVEEIAEIERQEKLRWAEEQKKARKEAVRRAVRDNLRREAGAEPADEAREREMAELVFVRINLPRLRLSTGREAPPDPILIDQRPFTHGWSGYLPKHLAEYLIDRQARLWEHVAQVDGRTRTFYNEQQGFSAYMGGPAQGGGPAPSFDAVHKRPA